MARIIEKAKEEGRAEGAAAAQAHGLAPAPKLHSMPSPSKAPLQTAIGTMLHNNDNI